MSAFQNSIKLLLISLGLTEALVIPSITNLLPQGSLMPGKGSFGLATVPKQDSRSIAERFNAELSYISSRYGVNLLPNTLLPRAGPGTSNPTVPYHGNAAYTIQLNIGGQKVTMDPDTGSNVLWVPTPQIAGNLTAPASWNASLSSTSSLIKNSSWSIAYYSSSSNVAGQVYTDNIYWGDVGSSATLNNASVFVANSSGSTQNGGILGLDHNLAAGYTVNGTAKTTPSFFQQLIPTLPQPVFTFDLKNGANGTLDFGFINATKYTGSIQYLTCANGTSWQTTTTGYSIGGGPSNTTRPITFVVDTGSSLMYLSKDIVSQYWGRVNGSFVSSSGIWEFPCASTLPDLTVYLNGKPAVTPGRYFNYGSFGNGTCYGGLQNNFLPGDVALYGDVWIKSQFLVFMNATSSNPNAYIGVANKTLTT